MGCLSRVVAAGALATVFAANAHAADMPRTSPLPSLPERTPAPFDSFRSGWYLRGDLGNRWGLITGAESAPGFRNPGDSKLSNELTASLGVGIKSDWLRTDVTLDYAMPAKYSGAIAAPGDVTAKIQSAALLFNGYFDLGTWYRLAPYLGAGVGAAYVRASDYQSLLAPPFAADTAHSQWNFAWAGMAGVAWTVAPNLMIDFGYRYLNVGNVKTASDTFGAMTFRNVAAHELRVGLRWSFDDLRSER